MITLDAARVASLLQTRRLGRSLQVLAETGSTNDDARNAAKHGAEDGHVIVADAQTQGRGARGHTWSSPAGVDLYLSAVVHVGLPLSGLPPLTLAVGVAVAETVAELASGCKTSVKWPNDVWLDEKKIAGVLIESTSTSQHAEPVVIGIGINVNRLEFPQGLDTAPTSLALATGAALERERVLGILLGHVETWVDRFISHGPSPIVQAVNERLALRAERVRCEDLLGTVLGVAESGALVLDCEGVRRECHAGSLRRA